MNSRKSTPVIILLLFFTLVVKAQNKLVKDSAITINDMQYGYTITNIQSKEDYERYEVRFFVINTGCAKYISNRNNISFNSRPVNIIADFSCLNATGKRLTNKGKTLMARDWNFIMNESISKDLAGKSVQLGYVIARGETVSGTEIILTPKGEFPLVQVTPVQIREINY
jgi:hypothetical protein